MIGFLIEHWQFTLPTGGAVYLAVLRLRAKNHDAFLRLLWLSVVCAVVVYLIVLALLFGGGVGALQSIGRDVAQIERDLDGLIQEAQGDFFPIAVEHRVESIRTSMNWITNTSEKVKADITLLRDLALIYVLAAIVSLVTGFVLPREEASGKADEEQDNGRRGG